MNDQEIVELFWQRDKAAIEEVGRVYQKLLYHIAENITASEEDAKECVNDTYWKLWNAIPPKRPESLRNYAAQITRNLAIDTYRKESARKKEREVSLACKELEEMIPDRKNEFDQMELRELINDFLKSLNSESRVLFMKRYWQTESIQSLAKQYDLKESAVKMRLSRIRKRFRKYLLRNGVEV